MTLHVILALDTTTRAGSVRARRRRARVVERARGDATRSHAERLPGELIVAARGAPASRWPTIDLFAVASGPGSFTGLRIGIATMQGLAFVHAAARSSPSRRSMRWPQHVARAALRRATLVGAWMDAHRRDVFGALYRVRGRAGRSAASG